MPKEWHFVDVDQRIAKRISKTVNVSLPVAKLLVSRGLTKPKEIKVWLAPDLKDLHKPESLTAAVPAAERILKAIKNGEKICVFGDFDVDGITSTAVLFSVLRELKAMVTPIIPDRFGRGYGLNEDAIRSLAKNGFKLIITVDCGISNIAETALANELGLEVIIVDHHEPPAELPPAEAIINPRRSDCPYPFKDLAGVGLAFKLVQVMTDMVGCPDLAAKQLDLVAVGTVADLASLVGENRILVHHGLALSKSIRRIGLAKLCRVSGVDQGELTATQISFALAPRLNAAGRMSSAKTAFELLMTTDSQEASRLASKLDNYNRERQKVEQKMCAEAVRMIESQNSESCIVLGSPDWHEGVKGIVASRLVDRYYRPTILFTIRDGLCIGSGRSIPGFNLHEALAACQEYLVRWGGHKAAAGLTVREKDFDKFKVAFARITAERLKEENLVDFLAVDLEIEPEDIGESLIDEISRLAPFGAGNPMPTLALSRVFAEGQKPMGAAGDHLRLMLQADSFVREAVAFRVDKAGLLFKAGQPLDVAFHLNRRAHNGRSNLQIKIVDVRAATKPAIMPKRKRVINLPSSGSGFLLPIEADATTATHLSFIDRRGSDDKDGVLRELLDPGLETVVYVRDEYEGVQLANRLSVMNGGLNADVSITCQPSDVAVRLVVYQAPLTSGALKQLCVPLENRDPRLVYLLYGADDVLSARHIIESLCPGRQRLAEVYRLLRDYGPFDIDEAAGLYRRRLASEIYPPATRNLAGFSVKVFSELGLVAKQDDKLIVVDAEIKVDLRSSPTWRRAERLRDQAAKFAAMAMTVPPERLIAIEN